MRHLRVPFAASHHVTATERGDPEYMSIVSYSQNLEDVMLHRVFRDVSEGFYIDVGAWHPIHDSVTMHFYSKGWSGINIEPSGQAHVLLVAHRTRDINLQVALGDTEGETTLFETAAMGLSTIYEDLGRQYLGLYENVDRKPIHVTTLKNICEEHVYREIDLLKIDVEGSELSVIRGGDWRRFRPRIVLVEATVPASSVPSWEAWEPILIAQDYEFVYFDGLNRF